MLKTVDQLKDDFRSDLDDPERGPADAPDNDALWKNTDVLRYMNAAAERVATDTEQLIQTYTLPVKAGDPFVSLPRARITDIHRVRLVNARRILTPTDINQIGPYSDYGHHVITNPFETRAGVPRQYARDVATDKLRLVPIPQTDDTLEITATALPAELFFGMPLPFYESQDIELMLLWMKKMAYEKHDADTFDSTRARDYEEQFTRGALKRKYEHKRRTNAVTKVRFRW